MNAVIIRGRIVFVIENFFVWGCGCGVCGVCGVCGACGVCGVCGVCGLGIPLWEHRIFDGARSVKG